MLDLAIDTLRNAVNLAVVGLSRYPGKPAHDIPILLASKEYNVIGVNPSAVPVVNGISVVERLLDVDLEIDIVNVFRPSSDADAVIDQAIERHLLQGDVDCIWLQEGITSQHGAAKCAEAGIRYIEDTCIYVVYQYLRV